MLTIIIVKKASKRVYNYVMYQLKRAGISQCDMSVLRPVL